MPDHFVAALMGPDSDLEAMRATLDTVDKPGVPREIKITSAHRLPVATHDGVLDAVERRDNAEAVPARDQALKERPQRSF